MTGRHTIDLTNAWDSPAAVPPPAAPGCGSPPPGAWARSFGRPTGLSSGDRIWLVFDGGRGCRVILNDAALPAVTGSSRHAVEITSMLRARNRLVLLPAHGDSLLPPQDPTSLPAHGRCRLPAAYGGVRLEIEATVGAGSPPETPAGA